jgi:hypothetical protein
MLHCSEQQRRDTAAEQQQARGEEQYQPLDIQPFLFRTASYPRNDGLTSKSLNGRHTPEGGSWCTAPSQPKG